MSPQAPRSLEYEVNGREVGGDQIKVEVQTLLRHLGGNEDFSAIRFPLSPKDVQGLVLTFLAPVCRKAGVEEEHFRSIGEALADTLTFALQRFPSGKSRYRSWARCTVLTSASPIPPRARCSSKAERMLGRSAGIACSRNVRAACGIGLEMLLMHLFTRDGRRKGGDIPPLVPASRHPLFLPTCGE